MLVVHPQEIVDKKKVENDLQAADKRLKNFNGIKNLKIFFNFRKENAQIKAEEDLAVRRCRLHKVYSHCKQRKQSFTETQCSAFFLPNVKTADGK